MIKLPVSRIQKAGVNPLVVVDGSLEELGVGHKLFFAFQRGKRLRSDLRILIEDIVPVGLSD